MRKKVVWLPYDFDTAIGINNEGALVFSYNLEDTDHLSGGADVFNGQESVVWNNLRDAFSEDIKAMYQDLRSKGKLSYEAVEEAFEEHQEKWSEAIFNEDAYFKYLAPLVNPDTGKEATSAYLTMLQGDKKQQRRWWLYNRFRYMDSKYNAGDALTDVIQLRGYAKDNISVTPYADVYASIKYGSYLVQTRAERNVPVTLVCPLDKVNDTEIYIYSASQLAAIGDLSGLKVGFADFSNGTKLSSLKVGDASSSYNNPNLKTLYVGTNGLLQTVDVRNCSALGTDEQTTVDLSGATNIENVYFDGTAVKGVSLPNGGILKVLHLPSTITNLTILNQQAITDFTVPSIANVTTLRIENSSVDSKSILNSIAANSRVRLIGFTWECQDAAEIESLLDKFDTMRGLDEQGNNMDKAQVSGTLHTASLTGAQVASYNERYPYINVTADNVTSVLTFKSYDGETTIKTVNCVNGVMQDTAPAVPSRASTAQYSFTPDGWSRSIDGNTDSTALINVIADRTVYAAYIKTVRAYTVTWKNTDGTVLETDNNVPYGATPTYNGATPTYDGETSRGWAPAISTVTGDITYTASYKPVYQVTFKSQDGATTLQTVSVKEGETATYTGSTPTNADGTTFLGWSDSMNSSTADAVLTNIQASKTVYAAHEAAVEVAEISDTWDTIIANIDNGTYSTKYKVGNYKPLDLGTYGSVNMQIVGKDVDELANGRGTAPLTFLSMELLLNTNTMYGTSASNVDWNNSSIRSKLMNDILPQIPAVVSSRLQTVIKHTYQINSSSSQIDTVFNEKLWIPSFREVIYDHTNAEKLGVDYRNIYNNSSSRVKTADSVVKQWWTRSASASSTATMIKTNGLQNGEYWYTAAYICLGFCLGLEPETITDSWDTILANENPSASYSVGDTKELDLGSEGKHLMQIVAFDTDDKADGSGKAKITWISRTLLNTSHVMNSTPKTAGDNIGNAVGGWEISDMRSYLKNTIKPLIPANVRNGIVEVTKIQGAYLADGCSKGNQTTTDDVWIPSRKEIFNSTYFDGAKAHAYNTVFKDDTSRKKHKNGESDIYWWLRSGDNSKLTYFCVHNDGTSNGRSGMDSGGVALGFCTD